MGASRVSTTLFLLIFLLSCTNNENYIKSQIQKANYCETKEDCVLVEGKCPFDCYIYSNKEEAGRIKMLVDNFESRCMYGCLECPEVECSEGKCRPVCT